MASCTSGQTGLAVCFESRLRRVLMGPSRRKIDPVREIAAPWRKYAGSVVTFIEFSQHNGVGQTIDDITKSGVDISFEESVLIPCGKTNSSTCAAIVT